MAHRYRLCPDEAQEAVLREHCAHARFVWNLAVEQQSWWWPGRGGAPSPAARMRQLAEARAAESWLAQGSSSVQQQALRDLDKALIASGEQHYRVPRIGDRRTARYLALHRQMSRQQKRSRNREKTRRAMAAITVKVTDRRKYCAEKISTLLVRDHELIVF